MNQNYKITIQYDGTRYFGWEHQPDKETVQGKIEDAIVKVLNVPLDSFKVIGAGRTDAGVHAKEMTASVILDTTLAENTLRDKLNENLPSDIAILSVKVASERFHARYNAVGKTYDYTICDGPIKPIFNRKYVTVLDNQLDIDAMKEAAEYLMGEHDFKAFCGNSKFKKSSVRIVDKITLKRQGSLLTISFHGTGFLQNMVRIMVGTLIEVGYHRLKPTDIPDIIESRDRKKAGPTAPAKGLCLRKVDY